MEGDYMAKVSEAQLKAQAKYDKSNTTGFYLKLNNKTDMDIIEKLDQVNGKQTYIKKLIRDDIQKGAEK